MTEQARPETDSGQMLAVPQVLEALDAAVRGIAGVQSVDRTLQLIVDGVRDLVQAQYAALGIVSDYGRIEQFVTSGISMEQRALIGPLPRGHGLLGLIVRENRSIIIDDLNADERRHGFPPHHPEMTSFLGVPVRSQGQTIGNLYLTNKQSEPGFTRSDRQLVEMFGLHAGIAMVNARLHEEVQRLAVVVERERISQDLHDSIIQSLYAISLSLEDLPDIIAEDPAEGAARADRAVDGIHSTIRDIRNFIMGLQPTLLEEADLAAGIQSLAADFRVNTLVDVEVELDLHTQQPPPETAVHLLAMVREALSNIGRHSDATRAWISVQHDASRLRLSIRDNGRGFDPAAPLAARHRGLANLRARADTLGGRLEVTTKPGRGTMLLAEVPTTPGSGPRGSDDDRTTS